MSVLDDDFSVDGTWAPSEPGPSSTPRDWRSLYEEERARGEATEARYEELRWAEVAARSDAGVWKMRDWAGDENIWRRRAALLCQLGFKEDTDLALLYDCIASCMGHREFFVQKAMGWALREYARTVA
ncbi:MAG: DNA alkylation repair protein, partial [Deltaproteobacteria bacterium]|nr:DNA alkylation repair protein [Deltaproteobacteria bacterium]